ncbi:MAG: hypothetical protein ACOYJK_10470 [Prevotella sp.]|jgi:hypothetical protein
MEIEKFLAIRRDDRFSPNSVDKDQQILQLTCKEIQRMMGLANDIQIVDEADLAQCPTLAECYISMARSDEALQALSAKEATGKLVVNTAEAVQHCQRSLLDRLMREHHVPMPDTRNSQGFWLKRGDAAAQSDKDVVYCQDTDALKKAKADFRSRGIEDMVVSPHIPGDLVKFYGVGNRLFKYFYPSDDGISKFGDEERNGRAHHYAFDGDALQADAAELASLIGIDVYGGDAIVGEDGRYYIIDFNDWPSFSRCKEVAAKAIAAEIISKHG